MKNEDIAIFYLLHTDILCLRNELSELIKVLKPIAAEIHAMNQDLLRETETREKLIRSETYIINPENRS